MVVHARRHLDNQRPRLEIFRHLSTGRSTDGKQSNREFDADRGRLLSSRRRRVRQLNSRRMLWIT